MNRCNRCFIRFLSRVPRRRVRYAGGYFQNISVPSVTCSFLTVQRYIKNGKRPKNFRRKNELSSTFFSEMCGGLGFFSYLCSRKKEIQEEIISTHPQTDTMPLQPLTYTRDAATGPTLTGGRTEGARQGGGSGLAFTPPHIENLCILHCASCAAAV